MSHDRDLLAKLVENPAWEALKADVADKKNLIFLQLSKKLMAGAEVPDIEIAEARGFFKGMEFLLRQPAASVREIEKELQEVTDGEQ